MQDRSDTLGLNYRLGTVMRIADSAREELTAGDLVRVIGAVRLEQRAAEPDHSSWRDLPEGPLYIAEYDDPSNGATVVLHESEVEPVG